MTADTAALLRWGDGLPAIVRAVRDAVAGDAYWEGRLAAVSADSTAVHLGVFVEPYLGLILAGKKTVESRFAMRRYAPFGRVSCGDILLLKRSGGPIIGLCEVAEVWFYHLDLCSWHEIRGTFTEALCAESPAFWHERAAASFATLMRISSVRSFRPIPYAKRDRRGWVVLTASGQSIGESR